MVRSATKIKTSIIYLTKNGARKMQLERFEEELEKKSRQLNSDADYLALISFAAQAMAKAYTENPPMIPDERPFTEKQISVAVGLLTLTRHLSIEQSEKLIGIARENKHTIGLDDMLFLACCINLPPTLKETIFTEDTLDKPKLLKLLDYPDALRELSKSFYELIHKDSLFLFILEDEELFNKTYAVDYGVEGLLELCDPLSISLGHSFVKNKRIDSFYHDDHPLSPEAISRIIKLSQTAFEDTRRLKYQIILELLRHQDEGLSELVKHHPFLKTTLENIKSIIHTGNKPKPHDYYTIAKQLLEFDIQEPLFLSRAIPDKLVLCPISVIHYHYISDQKIEFFHDGSWHAPTKDEFILLAKELGLYITPQGVAINPHPIVPECISISLGSLHIKLINNEVLKHQDLEIFLQLPSVQTIISEQATTLGLTEHHKSHLSTKECLQLLKHQPQDLLLCTGKITDTLFAERYFQQQKIIMPALGCQYSDLDSPSKQKLRDKLGLAEADYFITQDGKAIQYQEAVSDVLSRKYLLNLTNEEQRALFGDPKFKILKQAALQRIKNHQDPQWLLAEYQKQQKINPLPYLTQPDSNQKYTSAEIAELISKTEFATLRAYLVKCHHFTQLLEKFALFNVPHHPSFILFMLEDPDNIELGDTYGTVQSKSPTVVTQINKTNITTQDILDCFTDTQTACYLPHTETFTEEEQEKQEEALQKHPFILALVYYELRTYYPWLSLSPEDLEWNSVVTYTSYFSIPRQHKHITAYGKCYHAEDYISALQNACREAKLLLDPTRTVMNEQTILFLQKQTAWQEFLDQYIVHPETKKIYFITNFLKTYFPDKAMIAQHPINKRVIGKHTQLFSTNHFDDHYDLFYAFMDDSSLPNTTKELVTSWQTKLKKEGIQSAANLFICQGFAGHSLSLLSGRALHLGYVFAQDDFGFDESDQLSLYAALKPHQFKSYRVLRKDENIHPLGFGPYSTFFLQNVLMTEQLDCVHLINTPISQLLNDNREFINPRTQEVLSIKDQQRLLARRPLLREVRQHYEQIKQAGNLGQCLPRYNVPLFQSNTKILDYLRTEQKGNPLFITYDGWAISLREYISHWINKEALDLFYNPYTKASLRSDDEEKLKKLIDSSNLIPSSEAQRKINETQFTTNTVTLLFNLAITFFEGTFRSNNENICRQHISFFATEMNKQESGVKQILALHMVGLLFLRTSQETQSSSPPQNLSLRELDNPSNKNLNTAETGYQLFQLAHRVNPTLSMGLFSQFKGSFAANAVETIERQYPSVSV